MKSSVSVMLLIAVLVVIAGCSNGTNAKSDTDIAVDDTFTGEIREFTIEAYKWEFSPSVIEVNKGDLVRITASSITAWLV